MGGPDAARQAAAHLSRQSADLIRVRIPDVGGITEALKIARAAEAFGVNCEIDPDDGNGGFAAAGLMGAVRNAMFLPWVTGESGERARTAGGLIRTPMTIRDGAVTLGRRGRLGHGVGDTDGFGVGTKRVLCRVRANGNPGRGKARRIATVAALRLILRKAPFRQDGMYVAECPSAPGCISLARSEVSLAEPV